MNRAIPVSFTIICLLSILLPIGCEMSVKASTDTIYVPTDYSTIQEAIDYADSGDTIFVRNGTYYEHVTVHKSVFLVGEDRNTTIVDGNETGNVITIAANKVSIRYFTIGRSGASGRGISVDHSSGNDICYNTITDNYEGIYLHYSSNNLVSGNTITNNHYATSLYNSINNQVSGNTITNNHYATSLYYSSNNQVSGNTITNNHYGIYLALWSSNNNIYFNNFNNTHQVSSDSTNFWDNGNEGNYWSNYTGQDLNEDGIGDTPYIIDAKNQDNYPLMGTFSDFTIALERETYSVTIVCNSTISDFRFEAGPETGNRMVRFNATGKDDTVGFYRVMIPNALMKYPLIVLAGVEEIDSTILDVSNEAHVYLYFTYRHGHHTTTIVSSKMLYHYNELLDKHINLQTELYGLNATYYSLLDNYTILLGNYSQLRESHHKLNNSCQEHLLDYSKNVHDIRNLMYMFAATTAIFIITTIYLSKHAHQGKTKTSGDTERHVP
jgi:parallel beta-helix repeat protein